MSIESLRLWSGKDITEFPNYDNEIKIPAFVNESRRHEQQKQWRQNYDAARLCAAVGAEKRKAHRADKRARDGKACLLLVSFIVTLLMIAGAVG
jgi:hypothetical protein